MNITPIAHIKTDFKEKFGIPRQSGLSDSLTATVIFEPVYRNADALYGIEGFSHLWLIFDFSKAHTESWSPTVRPPRLGGNKKVGVFASRSPFRPNSLGLSSVRLLKTEKTVEYGTVLIIGGADLLDGTPIYDIKPYLPYADAHADATGGYTDGLSNEKLKVEFSKTAKEKIAPEKLSAITDCLSLDPRPRYIKDDERIYKMNFDVYDISFKISNNTVNVIDVKRVD